jgi:hypothetical protein
MDMMLIQNAQLHQMIMQQTLANGGTITDPMGVIYCTQSLVEINMEFGVSKKEKDTNTVFGRLLCEQIIFCTYSLFELSFEFEFWFRY